jgi:hypothetical protein
VATEVFSGENATQITATTNLKTTPGRIFRIHVVTGTGQIDVYDHASTDTNLIFTKTTSAISDVYELGCPMKNGIRVKMAAAGTLTVVWS